VAHAAGALRARDIKRVTVDTMVQPQAVTFPTDAKLLRAAIKGLKMWAATVPVVLRIAKRAAMMAGRYAHAKQFQRHHRQLRPLRTRLGRPIRDICRKIAGQADLETVLEWPLTRASKSVPSSSASAGGSSEGLMEYSAPQIAGRDEPFRSAIRQALRQSM
jgi:transposase, IS5 family